MVNQPNFKKVIGEVKQAEAVPPIPSQKKAPAKEQAKPKEAKPKEAKKEAPPPKAAEAEEEEAPKPKPKNPLDLLPPSKMILDEWKRLYSNTKTNFREVAIKGTLSCSCVYALLFCCIWMRVVLCFSSGPIVDSSDACDYFFGYFQIISTFGIWHEAQVKTLLQWESVYLGVLATRWYCHVTLSFKWHENKYRQSSGQVKHKSPLLIKTSDCSIAHLKNGTCTRYKCSCLHIYLYFNLCCMQ